MPQAIEENVSLFGYYVSAARVAAAMGIGLGYAFDKYVKPQMPKDRPIYPFTDEELRIFTPDSLQPAAATGDGKTSP